MSEEDRALLFTVARVVLLGEAGSLVDQVERRPHLELHTATFQTNKICRSRSR